MHATQPTPPHPTSRDKKKTTTTTYENYRGEGQKRAAANNCTAACHPLKAVRHCACGGEGRGAAFVQRRTGTVAEWAAVRAHACGSHAEINARSVRLLRSFLPSPSPLPPFPSTTTSNDPCPQPQARRASVPTAGRQPTQPPRHFPTSSNSPLPPKTNAIDSSATLDVVCPHHKNLIKKILKNNTL